MTPPLTSLGRRALLAAPLLPVIAMPARAQISPEAASAFIHSTGEELVAVLNSRDPLEERRARVADILRRAVDIEGTGRFVLGRWWRVASAEEQAEYLRLFEQTLIRNLAARFGEFQGVRFSVGRSQARSEDDVLVTTEVQPADGAAVILDWRVGLVDGRPQIVDLVAEGTSLRLTQRSEYSSVIQRGGGRVAALLDAMRNLLARGG